MRKRIFDGFRRYPERAAGYGFLKLGPATLGDILKKLLLGTLFALAAGSANIAMADGWPINIVGN